jgi:hypothetical protein
MTTYNDDLHELTASEYCDDVVKKGLSIEFDVALDLVETSKNIPFRLCSKAFSSWSLYL